MSDQDAAPESSNQSSRMTQTDDTLIIRESVTPINDAGIEHPR